jgi:hypothetical protein
VIVPELLIVVLLIVVLFSAATRPLFADNESVVKVPLLVSVVLFSVLIRPLLAKIESALNVVTPLRFGMRALFADKESVDNVPEFVIVVENKLLSVDVPLTFSLAILAESVTEMRCVFMSPAPIFLAYNESVEIVPELLIVVELTEFNVEFPLTFNFAILAESVTDIRCVLMSPAPNFVAKIESALNTPFILNFLAYNESVEIVPELLIVVLLMVVLLSAATRPLFADNESVVKVPLLVSVVLFSVLMRPLLA